MDALLVEKLAASPAMSAAAQGSMSKAAGLAAGAASGSNASLKPPSEASALDKAKAALAKHMHEAAGGEGAGSNSIPKIIHQVMPPMHPVQQQEQRSVYPHVGTGSL